MAYSKCPKCDNTFFELVENSPAKSNFKLMFVQCSKCGAVVGVMDYYNIGSVIKKVEEKIDRLERNSSNTSSINNSLSTINHNIETLHRLINSMFQDKK